MTDQRLIEIASESERYATVRAERCGSDGRSRMDDRLWLYHYNRKHKELERIQREIDRAVQAKAEADYQETAAAWPHRAPLYGVRRHGGLRRIEYRGFGSGFQRMADGCVSDGGATYGEGYWRRRVKRMVK